MAYRVAVKLKDGQIGTKLGKQAAELFCPLILKSYIQTYIYTDQQPDRRADREIIQCTLYDR